MFQKRFVEKIKTHILCSVFFSPENRAVYEIMWKNSVQPYKSQMTVWRMRAFHAGYLRLQAHIQNMQ